MPASELHDSMKFDDPNPARSGNGRVWLGRMASAGFSIFEVVGLGGVGLIVGLLSGTWRASNQVAALPPVTAPGPGFAPAPGGLQEMGIWFGCLVVGGIGGLVIGLAIGLVLVPILALARSRARRQPIGS